VGIAPALRLKFRNVVEEAVIASRAGLDCFGVGNITARLRHLGA
jgi:hypothetical protein